MTVFNKNKIDFTKNKLFFGEELNTQRFDEFKYPIFDKLTQTQLGYFWDQKKYHYKKIEMIMRHSTMHKNISLLLISDIKLYSTQFKVEASILHFYHSSPYLN